MYIFLHTREDKQQYINYDYISDLNNVGEKGEVM